MKKIIRLTESDLVRLVKRIIVEQQSLNSEYFKNKKNGQLKTTDTIIISVDGIDNNQVIGQLRTNDNWSTFKKEVPENMDWEYTVSNDNQTLNLNPIGKKFSAKYWAYIK